MPHMNVGDIIMNDEDDIVAVDHEEAGLVLCMGCSHDFRQKHKIFDGELSRTELSALDVRTYQRCDGCDILLLTLAEE